MNETSSATSDALDHLDKIADDLLRRLDALTGADVADPISRQQYRVLAEIDRAGALSIGQLGQVIGSAQSTTSEIAARLVKSGLVRKRRGPGGGNVDGRVVTVELTDSGRKVCRDCRGRARERFQSVIGRVPPEERPSLALALRQLNELLRKGTE